MTGINYLDETWNVVTGCSGKGCKVRDRCWAKEISRRFPATHVPKHIRETHTDDDLIPFSKIQFHPDRLDKPLHWKKPRRIGVCFMSDLFDSQVKNEWRDQVFAVIAMCPNHSFFVLTKQPQEMRNYLVDLDRPFAIQKSIDAVKVNLQPEAKEEWRSIKEYEGIYEVSNHGRVRRCGDFCWRQKREDGILTPRYCDGHRTVQLKHNGSDDQRRIARLVLETFAGDPPYPNADTRHKNGIPDDDRLNNLCWGTRKDNLQDAARHGTAGSFARTNRRYNAKQISDIRMLRSEGTKLKTIAAKYGDTIKHISAICLGNKYKEPQISWPLPNVFHGISITDQEDVHRMTPELLKIPGRKWLSIEPMLSEIDFNDLNEYLYQQCTVCWGPGEDDWGYDIEPRDDGIEWAVIGCESGPKRRHISLEAIQGVVTEFQDAQIPVFVKQVEIDGKVVHDIEKFPKELRVREYPEA